MDISNYKVIPSAALVEKRISTPREWIIFAKARTQQTQ